MENRTKGGCCQENDQEYQQTLQTNVYIFDIDTQTLIFGFEKTGERFTRPNRDGDRLPTREAVVEDSSNYSTVAF